MTTTTTSETTPEGLRDEIAELEHELGQLERELGAATLDGRSTTAATKRAGAVRDAIRHREAAIEELERRRREAAEEAATGEASRARAATYEALGPYLSRIETYTRCRDAFDEAERALLDCPVDKRFAGAKAGYGRSEESDLDTGLIGAIPIATNGSHQRNGKSPSELVRGNLEGVSPARAAALRALAAKRAEEERSGRGVDRSQPRDSWNAEQRQAFEGELAAAEKTA